MSMTFYAFINRAAVPSQIAWQAAIDGLGLPLTLDTAVSPVDASGFVPVLLETAPSGFELMLIDAADVDWLDEDQRARIADLDSAFEFNWGRLDEGAAALGAAAALASAAGAVVYDGEEGIIYPSVEAVVVAMRELLTAAQHG